MPMTDRDLAVQIRRKKRVFNTVLAAFIVIAVVGGPLVAIATGQPWWVFLVEAVIASLFGVWHHRLKAAQPNENGGAAKSVP
jgi:hypothetical protein